MRKHYCLFLFALISSTGFSQIKPNGQQTPSPATVVNPTPENYSSGIVGNYIRTWDVNMPTSSMWQVAESNTIQNSLQTNTYSDGFQRIIQTVQKGITPTGKDMVSPKLYDNTGKESLVYLSYPSTTSDGKIKLNAFSSQATFFQSQYPAEQVFYSKTEFENSPLENVEKVMSAGNSWAGNNRGISYKYEANVQNEVRVWNVAPVISSSPTHNGFYLQASLYRGTITDAHNKRTVTYKDKEGKIILKKVEIKNDGAAIITEDNGWLLTYYVYDNGNNLRYTITPRAVDWLIQNSWPSSVPVNILDHLCFRYEYDDRGRQVVNKSPGADEVSVVYDAKGRAVLFRDGNLKNNGKWQYTLYDELDRIIETGLWTNSQTREAHESLSVNNTSYPTLSGSWEVLKQIFFDNYNSLAGCGCGISSSLDVAQFTGNWMNMTSANQYPYPIPILQSQQTLGLPTVSKTKVLNSSPAKYIYSVLFYDSDGNIIQSINTNLSGGKDILTTQYGFGGKVLASHKQHVYVSPSGQSTQNLYSRLEYDNAGRLLQSYSRINSEAEKLQANNQYNELGQLVKVELGKIGSAPIETLDFSYTLTGVVRAVNENFVTGSGNNRFFGEVLHRDFGFTKTQYNGNLSGVTWKGLGDQQQRAFGYDYDPANRVLKSDFTQLENSVWSNTTTDFSMKLGDGANPTTAYDGNGNILAMSQKALKLYQSEEVDKLVYQYENQNFSNRLISVSETASGTTPTNSVENVLGDFKDNVTVVPAVDDYAYDYNGNVISDKNKAITSVIYNYLNKPIEIQVDGKGTIKYVYDAAGEKLQKIIEPSGNGAIITYDYVGDFVYKNNQLQYCITDEGRVRPTITAGWAYDYFIKDHLGNIRAIVTDEVRTDGAPQATLENGAPINNQQLYYDNTGIGLIPRPGSFGTVETNGQQVQLLRKAVSYSSVGTSRLLKVMVKDKVNVTVDYYLPSQTVDNSSSNGSQSLSTIITQLFNAAGAPPLFAGKGAEISQQIAGSDGFISFIQPQHSSVPSSTPKAYLNVLFFDEQFKFVNQNSQSVPVSVSGSRQVITLANIEVPKNGYMFAYVSNESSNLVYFDNFQVSHVRGPLLEENHYNLFGAKLTNICSKALPGVYNSLGYQAKDISDEFDLDWYDFHARTYDPQIGRFLQQDPKDQFSSPYVGMGNNWVIGVDPDGKWLNIVIGAVVGAVINVVSNIDNINSFGDFIGYAGVGAASGALASVGQFAAAGAVTGLGNSLLGGERDPAKLLTNTLAGAGASVVGGALGGKLNSIISTPLSTVIGSQATHIVSNIASSALVGGIFGMAFTPVSGGDPWQNFKNGLRSGAISGAIATAVPMAINKFNKPSNQNVKNNNNDDGESRPLAPLTEKQELLKTEVSPPQKLLPPPKYEYAKKNGAIHWLKHSQGLKYVNGEFIDHPGKPNGPDLPRELTLKQYKEGASTFFGTTNSGTSMFKSNIDGRLYMYNSQTKMFGVAMPVSGRIITWYKLSDAEWNIKVQRHTN